MKENPDLYRIAMEICHDLGVEWQHPETGQIFPPLKSTDDLEKPYIAISDGMANDAYGVAVFRYLLGQFRIILIKKGRDEGWGIPGDPVRQMCTYQPLTLGRVLYGLRRAPDPEAFCRQLERPWNHEGEGDRIRLDNEDKLGKGDE